MKDKSDLPNNKSFDRVDDAHSQAQQFLRSLNSPADETQRRSQLLLNTLPILLIPLLVAISFGLIIRFTLGSDLKQTIQPNEVSPHFMRLGPLVAIVIIAICFTALILLVRLGRPRISAFLLVGGWTLLTSLFALRTSVASIWPALLIGPICAAGVLIDGAASMTLAALATILVVTLGWLETRGVTFGQPLFAPISPFLKAQDLPLASAAFWVATFWSIAALSYLLASGLQRSLQHNRAQAEALRKISAGLEARVTEQTTELLEQSRETARMEERTRVARDIHDTLAQGLTGIVVQLGAAQRALDVAPADVNQHLELAQRMAREALAEARRSIWNLRSQALERGDLAAALQGLAEHPLRTETSITFEQCGEAYALSPDVESSLLRICQEALVNVAKHANASQAQILLEYMPDSVRLCIRDNGVGFDESELLEGAEDPNPWSGFGLLGMRERIAALGGTLALTNEGGANVLAIVPHIAPPNETKDPKSETGLPLENA
jgi:signal transduction histidine kinase